MCRCIRSVSISAFAAGLVACLALGCGLLDGSTTTAQQEVAAELFVLDIQAGERLAAVVHASSRDHEQAAYVVARGDDAKLWFGGSFSQVFDSVADVRLFGPGDSQVLATVRDTEGAKLLVGWSGQFVLSEPYWRVDDVTLYGEGDAYIGFSAVRYDEKLQYFVVLYEDDRFVAGEPLDRLEGVTITPDALAVQYDGRRKGRRVSGLGHHLYSKRGNWTQLGEGGPFAVWGKGDDGYEVLVAMEVAGVYDELRDWHLDRAGDRLYYQGRMDREWYVVAESRRPGDDERDRQGPFKSVNGRRSSRISHTTDTDHHFYLANTGDGKRLVVGATGNRSELSEPFDSLSLEKFEVGGSPIAVGKVDGAQHVLSGASQGPGFKRLDDLQAYGDGAHLVYVGRGEDAEQVVIDDQPGDSFDKIVGFQMTRADSGPFYLGERGEQVVAVHRGQASTPFDAVDDVLLLADGGVAYVGQRSEQWYGVLGAREIGPYDEVSAPGPTPGGLVWFDGTRGENSVRVLDGSEGPAFAALGKPTFTDLTGQLAYAARTSRIETVTVGEDTEERVIVVDVVVTGTAAGQTFQRTLDDRAGKKYLGASTSDLPSIEPVPWTDDIWYLAESDGGTHVGHGTEVFGPFEEVKEATAVPDGSAVAFFARDDEYWSTHVGATAGPSMDKVSKLRFTPDDRQVIYDGKDASGSCTFVGAERYLKVSDLTTNRAKERLAYAGLRDDGWRLVVDGAPSAPFEGIDRIDWAPDSQSLYAMVDDADGSRLVFHLGADFVLLAAHDRVERPEFHVHPDTHNELGADGWEFSYRATDDRARRTVYRGEGYERFEREFFTANGALVATAKRDGALVVMGEQVTPAYGKISEIRMHPDELPYDLLAFRAESGDQHAWVLFDGRSGATNLGFVDQLTHHRRGTPRRIWSTDEVAWTPTTETGTNTLVWTGVLDGRRFTAVGAERYDGVRELYDHDAPGAAPTYVGVRDGREAVFAGGAHGAWYSAIRDLGFPTGRELPAYVGEHVYVQTGDPTDDGMGRRALAQVVVGGEQSALLDGVGTLFVGPSLADSVYTGKIDGHWSLRKGGEILGAEYDELAYLARRFEEVEEGEPRATYHFLGRLEDGWHEVHDGKEGLRVSELADLEQLAHLAGDRDWEGIEDVSIGTLRSIEPGPSGRSRIGEHVLIDAEGRFDYVAIDGDQLQPVHRGKPGPKLAGLTRIWYFADGEEVVYEEAGDEGVRLVQGSETSPWFDEIQSVSHTPVDGGQVAYVASRGTSAVAHLGDTDLADARGISGMFVMGDHRGVGLIDHNAPYVQVDGDRFRGMKLLASAPAPLAAVANDDGSCSLLSGTTRSDPQAVVYDVQLVPPTGSEQAAEGVLSVAHWLEGVLDREAGTLSIRRRSLPLEIDDDDGDGWPSYIEVI
jgi:hypothetical protein